MTPNPDKSDAALAVEAALHTYPLTPVPPQLRHQIMQRIQGIARPRFRLTWLDYALTLFGGSMAASPFIIWQSLTPHMVWQLQSLLYNLSQPMFIRYFVYLWLRG